MAPFREGTELPTDRKCSTRCNPRGFSHARRRIVGEKSPLRSLTSAAGFERYRDCTVENYPAEGELRQYRVD
jgi:hypothetical protein